ncbi:MAG: hypothetical protein SGJ20_01805 [Planctomycetota bacterium]|nr:hypothetical protein [Planctomycetota bacterium]
MTYWPVTRALKEDNATGIGHLVGALLVQFLFVFVITWVVHVICKRSQLVATITFSILLLLISGVELALPALVRARDAAVAKAKQQRLAEAKENAERILKTDVGPQKITDAGLVHPDHRIVLTLPDGWIEVAEKQPAVILQAGEPSIGSMIAVMAQGQSESFPNYFRDLIAGAQEQHEAQGTVLHRLETTLLGKRAICFIVEVKKGGTHCVIANIIAMEPINGNQYVLNYYCFDENGIDPASIPAIADRLQFQDAD